jgi:hypothetical protein
VIIGGIVAAASAAAASKDGSGGTASSTSTKPKPEPEPEPIDVSIPYDAAAVLAYKARNPKFNKKEYDDIVSMSEFKDFNTQYKTITAMEISLKTKQAQFDIKKAEFDAMFSSSTS